MLFILAHCICFFFHSYAAHRVLLSFPTRRSSDLQQQRVLAAGDRRPSLLLGRRRRRERRAEPFPHGRREQVEHHPVDRKSTRLNSSHLVISYAVFCLKKKRKKYKDNDV